MDLMNVSVTLFNPCVDIFDYQNIVINQEQVQSDLFYY